MRNATAFGASPRMRLDLVLNNLSGLAWMTGEIAMTSDGSLWRPLVHALDIGEAIRCALRAPREAVHNKVFNVRSDEQKYQVREIAEQVAAAFPGCTTSFGEPARTTAASGWTSARSPHACGASPATGTPPAGRSS